MHHHLGKIPLWILATVLKQNGFLLYNSFQWPNKTKVAPQQTNQSVLEPKQQQQRDPCDAQENASKL